MALKGNLDDFNILNIFQMIKLEGKTGRLNLKEGVDLVKITFDSGSIIYAETQPAKDEARMKLTLVANSLLSQADWDDTQREHEDKLKPYWELLARKIHPNLLIELIRRQTLDNVYHALRWKIGEYEFTPIKKIRYNEKVMTPMDVDGLLMEGCRLADEWPRAKKAIPPPNTFLVKNIIGEDDDESIAIKGQEGGAAGWESSLEKEILSARGIELRDTDVKVLCVVEEGKTIDEIINASRQGEFETLEALNRLLQLRVLKPSQRKKERLVAVDRSLTAKWITSVAVLIAVVVGGGYWQIASMPSVLTAQKKAFERVKTQQAEGTLKRIKYGLQVYYTLYRAMPEHLDKLSDAGIVPRSDLVDPWNNPYVLNVDKTKYALYSTGSDQYFPSDDVFLEDGSHR